MPRKEIKLCRNHSRQLRSPESEAAQTRHSLERGIVKKGVEVIHTSPEVATPLFLYCSNDNAAISALTALKA
jgi:hypothetical protein